MSEQTAIDELPLAYFELSN